MHTKCVHTTQHKRRVGGITLIHTPVQLLLRPARARSTTPHAPHAPTLRTEGAQAREQLSRGELPGLQRKSRRREWRLARAPSEALRGASPQCWPSLGADRPESPSLLSNRRRLPRMLPAKAWILRRKTREGRVGACRFLVFCSPKVWDLLLCS
jgi:hypothetical protein